MYKHGRIQFNSFMKITKYVMLISSKHFKLIFTDNFSCVFKYVHIHALFPFRQTVF